MPYLATFLMFAGASLFCLTLYGMQRRPHRHASTPIHTAPRPSCSTIEFITLVHQIKLAAGASRGVPDGDTIALREIVDLIKHFEDTH